MKIKLTPSQKEKLSSAINEAAARQEEVRTIENHYKMVQRQFVSSQKHSRDLIEMIGDVNGVDMKQHLESEAKFSIENDHLVVQTANKEKFSKRVKKAVKKK